MVAVGKMSGSIDNFCVLSMAVRTCENMRVGRTFFWVFVGLGVEWTSSGADLFNALAVDEVRADEERVARVGLGGGGASG